jgi:hypothetical protein
MIDFLFTSTGASKNSIDKMFSVPVSYAIV